MNSRLQRKLTYLRDRATNAFWMVRQGQFRQVCNSLLLELRTRKNQAGAVLAAPDTPLQRYGGRNPCKACPASPRPTITVQSTVPSVAPGELDAVAATLEKLLAADSHGGDTPGAAR
jgi:hypothetical protein